MMMIDRPGKMMMMIIEKVVHLYLNNENNKKN
jgi:hypothetical protein